MRRTSSHLHVPPGLTEGRELAHVPFSSPVSPLPGLVSTEDSHHARAASCSSSPDLAPIDWTDHEPRKSHPRGLFLSWSTFTKYTVANDSLSWGCKPSVEILDYQRRQGGWWEEEDGGRNENGGETHRHKRRKGSREEGVEETGSKKKRKKKKHEREERGDHGESEHEHEETAPVLEFELDGRGPSATSPILESSGQNSTKVTVQVVGNNEENIEGGDFNEGDRMEEEGEMSDPLGLWLTPSPAPPPRGKDGGRLHSPVFLGQSSSLSPPAAGGLRRSPRVRGREVREALMSAPLRKEGQGEIMESMEGGEGGEGEERRESEGLKEGGRSEKDMIVGEPREISEEENEEEGGKKSKSENGRNKKQMETKENEGVKEGQTQNNAKSSKHDTAPVLPFAPETFTGNAEELLRANERRPRKQPPQPHPHTDLFVSESRAGGRNEKPANAFGENTSIPGGTFTGNAEELLQGNERRTQRSTRQSKPYIDRDRPTDEYSRAESPPMNEYAQTPNKAIEDGHQLALIAAEAQMQVAIPQENMNEDTSQRNHQRQVQEFWSYRMTLRQTLRSHPHHSHRYSHLAQIDHKRYFELMALFALRDKQPGVFTEEHRQELSLLSQCVIREQTEYLQSEKQFALAHVPLYHSVHPNVASMLEALLFTERQYVRQYQRYYRLESVFHLETTAPADQPVFTFSKSLWEVGSVLPVRLPKAPFQVPYNISYFSHVVSDSPGRVLHWQKKPMPSLFQDEHAMRLALQCGADIVISSSGLQALFDTAATSGEVVPKHNNQWELPSKVVVVGGQRVVVVGRPLLRKTQTCKDMNVKFYSKAFESSVLNMDGERLRLNPQQPQNSPDPNPPNTQNPPLAITDGSEHGADQGKPENENGKPENENEENEETEENEMQLVLVKQESQHEEPTEDHENGNENQMAVVAHENANGQNSGQETQTENRMVVVSNENQLVSLPNPNEQNGGALVVAGTGGEGVTMGGQRVETGEENVTYTLWQMGPYKVLVRSRVHGYFVDPQHGNVLAGMRVKPEYMPTSHENVGPEAPGPGERAKWWLYTLLRSRPSRDAHLLLGRVNMLSMSIQWEHLTLGSIYGSSTPDPEVLPLFRNMMAVFKQLHSFDPGNYLVAKDYGEATVKFFKAIDTPTRPKDAYDLYAAQERAGAIDTTSIPWLHSKGENQAGHISHTFPLPPPITSEENQRLTVALKNMPKSVACCFNYPRNQRCTTMPCPYPHIPAHEILAKYGDAGHRGEWGGKKSKKKKGKQGGKGKKQAEE